MDVGDWEVVALSLRGVYILVVEAPLAHSALGKSLPLGHLRGKSSRNVHQEVHREVVRKPCDLPLWVRVSTPMVLCLVGARWVAQIRSQEALPHHSSSGRVPLSPAHRPPLL